MVECEGFHKYSIEELTALHKSIEAELKKREEEDKWNCIIEMNALIDKFAKWHNSVAFNNWRKEFNDIYARDITEE